MRTPPILRVPDTLANLFCHQVSSCGLQKGATGCCLSNFARRTRGPMNHIWHVDYAYWSPWLAHHVDKARRPLAMS